MNRVTVWRLNLLNTTLPCVNTLNVVVLILVLWRRLVDFVISRLISRLITIFQLRNLTFLIGLRFTFKRRFPRFGRKNNVLIKKPVVPGSRLLGIA